MRLTHLSLTNFRNFSRLDVDVPGGVVLLVGDNAQGKTSLLEAIYFLATLASFHTENERQLINFLAAREPLAVARIVAGFERGGKRHRLEVRIIQETGGLNGGARLRKEVLLDSAKIKTNQVMGNFNAVLFLPHMLRIIDGAPEERRRYLNLTLGQVWPDYAEIWGEYQRILSQRNALLKQLAERSGDESQLDYWDLLLAEAGAKIISARIQAIKELEILAARNHQELTRHSEVLRLSYQPAYDPLPQPPQQYALPIEAPVDRSGISLEQMQRGFWQRLQQLRGEEISRGVTTIGPQRDELRFLSNGLDLGYYGSRGQARTAILAVKLAEVAWMRQETGHWPVLLLDEVLAELDLQRRADLLANLNQAEQALLTTTDLDMFSESFLEKSARWRVQGGRLTAETLPAP